MGIVARELMSGLLKTKIEFGRSVPVDYVVWRKTPHELPWLSRIGGIPWRDRSLPWPSSAERGDYTFVGQFCLSEAKDFYSYDLQGDLVLIFFSNNEAMYGEDHEVVLEWSTIELATPLTERDCPTPGFPVPQLFSELYRAHEYPDFDDMNTMYDRIPTSLQQRVGWLPQTEFTRLGTEAHWLQGYQDAPLLFALGCFSPDSEWPFPDRKEQLAKYNWDQWFDGDRIQASGTPMMYIQSPDGRSLIHTTEAS